MSSFKSAFSPFLVEDNTWEVNKMHTTNGGGTPLACAVGASLSQLGLRVNNDSGDDDDVVQDFSKLSSFFEQFLKDNAKSTPSFDVTSYKSLPLVDPLKVKSKAKDPVIAPPPGVIIKRVELALNERLGAAALLLLDTTSSTLSPSPLPPSLSPASTPASSTPRSSTPSSSSPPSSSDHSTASALVVKTPLPATSPSGNIKMYPLPLGSSSKRNISQPLTTKTITPTMMPTTPTMQRDTTRGFADVLRTNLPNKEESEGDTKATSTTTTTAGKENVTNTKTPNGASPRTLQLADYGRLLRAYASAATQESAREAENLLRTMIQDYNSGKITVRPDGACFNSVLHAYAEIGDAAGAHSILMLMFQEHEQGNKNAEPNVRVYTSVLHAWRKSNDPRAPEICEEILDSMHRLHDTGALPDCEPDNFAYTVLFHLWADTGREDAVENAERLFRKMKQRYLQGDHALRPDDIAYSNLLNIFKDSNDGEARAEDILWEMVYDYLSGNKSAKPRIRNFNTVLAMWSKSKSPDAAERAHSIVLRLIKLKECHEDFDVQPDPYTYSLLLKTWASSPHPNGANQAVKCLYWMKDLYRLGDNAARPDVIKYTTCISALARNADAEQAEALLNKMRADYLGGNRQAEPDAKMYEVVIHAWTTGTKVNIKTGAIRAEGLLYSMWTLDETGKFKFIRPSTQAYKRVIIALKKAHRPDRAEALLEDMDKHFQNKRLKEGPSKEMFQTVINAWNESRHADRKPRAYQLEVKMLERFRRSSMSPNK